MPRKWMEMSLWRWELCRTLFNYFSKVIMDCVSFTLLCSRVNLALKQLLIASCQSWYLFVKRAIKMQTATNSDVITFAFPALEAVYILFSCISHICRDLWRMLLSRPGYRTQLYETIFCSAKPWILHATKTCLIRVLWDLTWKFFPPVTPQKLESEYVLLFLFKGARILNRPLLVQKGVWTLIPI